MKIKICKTSKSEMLFVSIFILVILFCLTDSAAAESYTETIKQIGKGQRHIWSSSDVTTTDKHGLYAEQPNAQIFAYDNILITTTGDESHGAYANFSGTILLGDSATITVSGDKSFGAYSVSNSNIIIGNSANITAHGNEAQTAFAEKNSSLKIGDNVTITTHGTYSHGANAWSDSSIDIGKSATIVTHGKDSYGAVSHLGSNLKIGESATVTTFGDGGIGFIAKQQSSMEIGAGVNISTVGESAHGVHAYSGSSIRMNGGTISATGKLAEAVYSKRDSQIIGTGVFNITGNMLVEGDGGRVGSLIDLTLENGSTFTGKTTYSSNDANTQLNLTLNGADTQWVLTGHSSLSNLYMNGATVDFTQALGPSLTTFNLGQSDNDRGTFIMNTSLGDEIADRLIVTGEAKGTYILDIINDGGDATTGRELTDVVLIERAGQSVVFELDHIVESGGWRFDLSAPDRETALPPEQGLDSRALHRESAWYLYASGGASTAGSGAINSFAGSYLMAYAETSTLMQSMSDLRDSEYLSRFWFRVHGGKFESNAKSYVRGFDMKYGGVQIGYDRKLENDWDGELYLGAMFGYSRGDLDYAREGSGTVDSKALGIYGVYVRPDGFYIDAMLKYQWMNNDFDVIDTAGTLVRGNDVSTGGIGASVTVGKKIPLSSNKNGGWYAEPQIQLSYQHQDGGYFNATNDLNIGVDPFTSLLGRVGVLVGHETEKTNFYAKVSKVKEFDGDLTIHANGVPIAESFGDDWWIYGIGYSARINDRNSLHLDIERTSGGSFRQPWRINAEWRIEF